MTKLSDTDDNLSPLVRAAMIDEDGRPEEESVEDKSPIVTEDEEVQEESQPEVNEDEGAEDEPEKDKPVDEAVSEEEDEEPKLSRKERRAQRKAYLDAIRRDGEQNSQQHAEQLLNDPNYKPLDYNENPEVDAETLQKDREDYAKRYYARGAEQERFKAEQIGFWDRVGMEDQLLTANPKYAFLDPNSPSFDEDRAGELQELYFGLIGFDPNRKIVEKPVYSWKNFVETEVARFERWAESLDVRSRENLEEQRKSTGIRPNGSRSSSKLGKLKAGDIANMSDADYEKYKSEIDKQILEALQ